MVFIFAILIAYLIGSIPTGYIIAKLIKKIDIREHGSGNVGATNVYRSVGRPAAAITLVLDIFKGFVVVTLVAPLLYYLRLNSDYPIFVIALGVTVVVGHNWPVFLGFRGGKGIATSAGVMLGLCPKLLLIGLCVWILAFVLTKIVSLSSIISAAVIPLAAYYYLYIPEIRLLTVILALLTIARHYANIKRFFKNEEKRLKVKI